MDEYRQNILRLKKTLEASIGKSISDRDLDESIRLYNRMRRLLMALEESRKRKVPGLSGSEMLRVVMAVTAVPPEAACDLLEEVVEHVERRPQASVGDVRIVMLAGCMEEPGHLELYEEAGGVIVSDAFCMGARSYNRTIDERGDPWQALARGYLDGSLSCPRMMDDFQRRIASLASLARDYSADAIVVEKLKFCDMWGWEIERLRRESKKGVIPPVLAIEREYLGGASGQVKTRIQAFFEQIRNRQDVDSEILRPDRTAYYVWK